MLRLKQVLTLLIVVAFALTTAPVLAYQPSPYPTTEAGWKYSTPEAQGMRSDELAEFIKTFTQPHFNVNSLIVARHGTIVAELHGSPDQSEVLRDIKSGSKSVLSVLVGIAIDKGYIKGVDEKVLSFFPEFTPANMDDRKAAMTVRDLLTMGSGFMCDMYGTPGSDAIDTGAKDTAYQCLNKPMAYQPGEKFQYCQCNAYLLASILERKTGMGTLAFADKYLFRPLGITRAEWLTAQEGIAKGFVGLHLLPKDLAKIGQLFLNKGQWDGKQVVPVKFLEDATAAQIATGWPDASYGYQWWTIDSAKAVMAMGIGGQYILINPAKDVLVVLTGEFTQVLRAALQGYPLAYSVAKLTTADAALPAAPEQVNQLKAVMAAFANPAPQPVAALPAMAKAISGKTFAMMSPVVLQEPLSDFRLEIKALSLRFGPGQAALAGHAGLSVVPPGIRLEGVDQAVLTLVPVEGQDKNIAVGLDGLYRVSEFWGGKVAAKGAWVTDHDFRVYMKFIGDVMMEQIDFSFMPGAVMVVAHECVWDVITTHAGMLVR